MNEAFDPSDHPHRRFNPLTGDWVLVSPHRAKRPWSGRAEALPNVSLPDYAPDCPLCPQNVRANGERNPKYEGVFWFENDFAALLDSTPEASQDHDLFRYESASGATRVVCFSPDHSKTLPELSVAEVGRVLETWRDAVTELSQAHAWVQVFENKGEIMGCSQPHPHSQIWASSFLPNEVAERDRRLRKHFEQRQENLLERYVADELARGERIVIETEYWLGLVPFWAAWPFETMLLPKAPIARFEHLSADQLDDLALALKRLTTRYDNLFECSFPYSMGWHFAPTPEDAPHWRMYALFLPPLLRSATVRKFMVGYEMLAEPQRDLTPEQAAQRLRTLSDIHYKERT